MTTNFKQRNASGVDVDLDEIYASNAYLNTVKSRLPATVYPGETMWLWGSNTDGSLGDNTIVTRSSPTQVGSLTNWVMVSKGGWNTLALKSDGTIWSWGYNTDGRLGLGDTSPRSSPVQIGSLTNWAQVVAGPVTNGPIAIVDEFGSLYTCGANSSGALGLGLDPATTGSTSSPVIVSLSNMGKVAQVAVGQGMMAAIDNQGRLYTWGESIYGGTGRSTTVDVSQPNQVGSLTNWAQVACGSYNMLAVKTDGTLWSWGDGGDGILGKGNLTTYSSPVQVGTLQTWKKVSLSTAAASVSVAAIKTNGTLWAWGPNDNGQVGKGNITPYSSPVQVGSLTDWADVEVTSSQVTALKTDGTLWAWGDCSTGPFSTNVMYSSPVQVGSLTTWFSITKGGALKLV